MHSFTNPILKQNTQITQLVVRYKQQKAALFLITTTRGDSQPRKNFAYLIPLLRFLYTIYNSLI